MATFSKPDPNTGTIKAQVLVGTVNGRARFKAKRFATRKLAERWAHDVEAERDGGADFGREQTIAAYYAKIRPHRHKVNKWSTTERNNSHWRLYLEPGFGKVRLSDLRRSTVQKWVAEQHDAGVGVPTLESATRLLSAIVESAVADDLLPANPVHGVKMPEHSPRRVRWISPDEMDSVVAQLVEPYRLVVDLAANTGLRWGEVAGLTANAIAPDGKTLRVLSVLERSGRLRQGAKTVDSERVVSIPPRLRQRVLEQKIAAARDDGLIFTNRYGDPLSGRNVNARYLPPACVRAGVEPFSFHATRHAYISWMVASGMELFEIARLVGHTSTQLIERTYGHLRPGVQDRAADALERGRMINNRHSFGIVTAQLDDKHETSEQVK